MSFISVVVCSVEFNLFLGAANRTLRSSFISLTFPLAMRTECCTQTVAYLSYYQYTDHRSIILGVKVPREYVAPVAYEHCPCSVGCMDATSVVSGNGWERFHVCWQERFNAYIYMFCQSSAGTLTTIEKLRTVRMHRLAI